MRIREIEFIDNSEKIICSIAERPCFYLARNIDGGCFVASGGVIETKKEKKVIIFCCSKDNNVVYWPSGAIGVFDDEDIMRRFALVRRISSLNMKITFEF